MARKTDRPKLATRYAGPRGGTRDLVSLEGRCQVGENDCEDIVLLDLDTGGCRVRGITAAVTKTDAVAVWLGPLGPFTAHPRWVKRGLAGLRFDPPLEDSTLEEAKSRAVPAPPSEVIALRRRVASA
ncbi:MAG: hypothetical protein R3E18_07245 [Sphingomonadaceae bacterium]|nr:hypothetical protein [Sphingomonadaceae bacterium]